MSTYIHVVNMYTLSKARPKGRKNIAYNKTGEGKNSTQFFYDLDNNKLLRIPCFLSFTVITIAPSCGYFSSFSWAANILMTTIPSSLRKGISLLG